MTWIWDCGLSSLGRQAWAGTNKGDRWDKVMAFGDEHLLKLKNPSLHIYLLRSVVSILMQPRLVCSSKINQKVTLVRWPWLRDKYKLTQVEAHWVPTVSFSGPSSLHPRLFTKFSSKPHGLQLGLRIRPRDSDFRLAVRFLLVRVWIVSSSLNRRKVCQYIPLFGYGVPHCWVTYRT